MAQQQFHIHKTARLLTPDAPGAELLWQALSQGHSLYARQSRGIDSRDAPDGQAWVFCESSGSTGTPKVIRRSPSSWIASFEVNQGLFGVKQDTRYAVLGDLGHSLTLYAAVEALHLGASLALLGGQRPDTQARQLRASGITHLYATPSQLRILLSSDDLLFSSLSHVICGGGAMTGELRENLTKRAPNAKVTEFFGASETSFIALSYADTPPGAVGRAYPGVDLRIAPLTKGQDIGEIWVKSPYLFDGYEEGDSTETQWRDGYLAIGELGRVDALGNLFLSGRRNRMVTVSDHNVYPETIEAVLMAQPDVEAAAVLALPDALRGHRIVAAIQGPATAASLRAACRAALGDHAVPKDIRTVDPLPLLPAGKPDLEKLRALWMNGVPS